MSASAKPLPPTFVRLPRLVALWLIAFAMAAPFLWMILTSLKPLQEVESFNPIPKNWKPDNYSRVFEQIPYARYYFNSIFVAVWVTTLQVFTSALAAFAFSRLVWPGRDSVFKLYLATLMIPGVVTMIPNYTLLVKLRLLDSYTGLILPAAFTAFGTFLLRQFMLQIPRSLDEAAEIDGASRWQTFWLVVLPLCRPSLVTLGVFSFLGTYGSFFWPLVLIKTEGLRTLPIGMLFFDSAYGKQTNLIMAASLMSVLPLIIAFLCTQRLVVKGIQAGAVKG
jgi:multiple sugar transport system permease protein